MHQISTIYFVIKLDMFRASSVPIIRSYLLFQPVSARKWSHSLHETYQLPCVQYITPDDGHRNCPKRVEFYDKINVGYLMHLVGCFIRSFSRCTVTWTRVYIHSISKSLCLVRHAAASSPNQYKDQQVHAVSGVMRICENTKRINTVRGQTRRFWCGSIPGYW